MAAMDNQDVRWQQRFSNFIKALDKLDQAVLMMKSKNNGEKAKAEDEFLDDMLKEALIQRFEYTHELAWKVMKDYMAEVGNISTMGSRDTSREAFSAGLIEEGEVWMEMIKSRNMTSHTYNEETANEIYIRILESYHQAFVQFERKMQEKIKTN